MIRKNYRFERVERTIIDSINALISFGEIKSLKGFFRVYVSRCILSKDFAYAKVYFEIDFNENEDESAIISKITHALSEARGFIQMQIKNELSTRLTPKLTFVYDSEYHNLKKAKELIKKELNDKQTDKDDVNSEDGNI